MLSGTSLQNFTNNSLNADCLQDGFGLDKNKAILLKREVIIPIPDSMISVDFFQKSSIINFIPDDITSGFELFSKKKMNNIYLTEIMITDWIHMLD